MSRIVRVISLMAGVLLVLGILLPVAAQDEAEPVERDPAEEQVIYDRLSEVNADAVPLFKAATEALDSDKIAEAEKLYKQALALVPDSADILRRLSYTETGQGDFEAGIRDARRALALDDSAYNHLAVARALVATENEKYTAEALDESWKAAGLLPDDPEINALLLYTGTQARDEKAVRQASMTLVRVTPDYPYGHLFAGLVAASDSQWETAEAELQRARELGAPEEAVQEALNSNSIPLQAGIQRLFRAGLVIVASWAAGMLALLVIGSALSWLTLAAVRRTSDEAMHQPRPAERLIRRMYRIVIVVTSLYFYVSLPVVMGLVLVVALGALYVVYQLMASSGWISIKGLAAVGILAFVLVASVFAMLRSLFFRIKDRDPGEGIQRDDAPDLWRLVEEVAGDLKTRPVDEIYLTPGSQVAVFERGGIITKLRGAGKRYLVLGLGVLPGMTQGQLKSILAHEYGHFSNRDTAGGNLSLQVQITIQHMAFGLARNGGAAWFNPGWLFLNAFYRIFLRITRGASRLQEILADRYAVLTYGARDFTDGLQHVVRQSITFDFAVNGEIKQALTEKRDLNNVYTLPEDVVPNSNMAKQLNDIMNRPTSPYDSHPSISERIDLINRLPSPIIGRGSTEPAWDLLPDAAKFQAEMTKVIQNNVHQALRQRAAFVPVKRG